LEPKQLVEQRRIQPLAGKYQTEAAAADTDRTKNFFLIYSAVDKNPPLCGKKENFGFGNNKN